MSSNYTVIKTAVFSSISEVRFYEETLQHIQDDHPEIPILLPSLYSSLSQTITNPSHIESGHTNSFVFVDTETTNASGDPLRIPVKIIEGTSGLLKSAYFASTANPNVVWRRR